MPNAIGVPGAGPFRFGWAVPDTGATSLAAIDIAGRREARVAAGAVNPTPTTQNHADANTGFVLIDVTTMNVAGDIRLTGTSYNPDDGTTTGADTEDISIGATGWYQSVKRWRGVVVISSVTVANVVIDSYSWVGYRRVGNWILTDIAAEYKVTGAANTSRVIVDKFTPMTGFTNILDETVINITTPTKGSHERSSLSDSIDESAGERLYVHMEAQRLAAWHFEIRGT